MGAKKLAIVYAGGMALTLLTAYTGTKCNWQGEQHLEGRVLNRIQNCDLIVNYKNPDPSYAKKCSSTLVVSTEEGSYTIGALGSLEEGIEKGSDIEFLKQSTRWVTSFGKDRTGFLSAESIKLKK